MTIATDLSIRSRSYGKSILRSAFDNIVEARQRQADRYVAGTLAMLRRDGVALGAEERRSLFEARTLERS